MSGEARAVKVAEACAAAWHGRGGGSDGHAVGVVAALALLGRRDPAGPAPGKLILALPDDGIGQMLTEVWCRFTIMRPELAMRCGPLAGWVNDEPPARQTIAALAAVARAAVKAGLLDLTLGRADALDVLGPVWTILRTGSARSAQGEYYTPHPIAEMLARLTMTGIEPGAMISEPAAGTGSLLLGAAAAIRDGGGDPADFGWCANDVSPVAVGCLAVNVHLWGLGRRIVLGIADSLAEPDWPERAAGEQARAVAAQEERQQLAGMLAAIRGVQALTGTGGAERPAEPPGLVLPPVPDDAPPVLF